MALGLHTVLTTSPAAGWDWSYVIL